jgi:transposase-like protein
LGQPLALTGREREEISRQVFSGSSIRDIARLLKRAPSTISRETPSLRVVAASPDAVAGEHPIHEGRSDKAMKYSAAFKAKMVQKMLGGRSANSLAQESGMHQPTLSKWLREAASLQAVRRRKQSDEAKTEGRRPDDRSAEEKLEAVLEAKRLSGSELGEFLRRRGLHEEQLRGCARCRDCTGRGAGNSVGTRWVPRCGGNHQHA